MPRGRDLFHRISSQDNIEQRSRKGGKKVKKKEREKGKKKRRNFFHQEKIHYVKFSRPLDINFTYESIGRWIGALLFSSFFSFSFLSFPFLFFLLSFPRGENLQGTDSIGKSERLRRLNVFSLQESLVPGENESMVASKRSDPRGVDVVVERWQVTCARLSGG